MRQKGLALIERNWFENAVNPATSRYDGSNFGTWVSRDNNVTSASQNATYNITWTSDSKAYVNAQDWTPTGTFPSLPYSYAPVRAQCVKAKLTQFEFAGQGKGLAVLTTAACN